MDSDKLSEPILRAKLKHYFTEKYRFHDVFEQVDMQLETLN